MALPRNIKKILPGSPKGKLPSRAEQGAKYLAELKRQGSLLFRRILPMGPQAFEFLQSAERDIVGGKQKAPPTVLDLLLRLSEAVGADSGYARILRGASEVFARRGFEEARIEEILACAKVSPRTYYQFFRNKNEVLEALFDLYVSVWLEIAENEVKRGASPEEKILRFAMVYAGAMAVAGPLAPILMTESLRPGTAVARRYETVREKFLEILLPVYGELRRGEVDPAWARSHLAAAHGLAVGLRLGATSPITEVAKATSLFLEILTPPMKRE
ncbi:MAG: TetR/AcrR family transcriptional regulator [Bdellovibrionota bacterium]